MAKNYEAITCKVALFTPSGDKVLVVEYANNGGYGLPGGHLESGEEPAMSCVREVKEELGMVIPAESLILKDAWRHPHGKIILGYVASISENETLRNLDTNEISAIRWITVEDIEKELVPVGTYRQFIIDNQQQVGS